MAPSRTAWRSSGRRGWPRRGRAAGSPPRPGRARAVAGRCAVCWPRTPCLTNTGHADPALNRPGKIFRLTDWGTASSATYNIWNPGATPTRSSSASRSPTLRTCTATIRSSRCPGSECRWSTPPARSPRSSHVPPDIPVAPTVAQLLAGTDPCWRGRSLTRARDAPDRNLLADSRLAAAARDRQLGFVTGPA
jgi:hypothetical protein